MRKLLLISAFLVGVAYAATNNPTMTGPSVLTAAQVLTSTPTYVGQVIVCSNCGSVNSGLGALCISTTTANANNAYILLTSSLSAVTACR